MQNYLINYCIFKVAEQQSGACNFCVNHLGKQWKPNNLIFVCFSEGHVVFLVCIFWDSFYRNIKIIAINTISWCDLLWYLKLASCFYSMQEGEKERETERLTQNNLAAGGNTTVSCLRLLPILQLLTEIFFQNVSLINALQIQRPGSRIWISFFFF